MDLFQRQFRVRSNSRWPNTLVKASSEALPFLPEARFYDRIDLVEEVDLRDVLQRSGQSVLERARLGDNVARRRAVARRAEHFSPGKERGPQTSDQDGTQFRSYQPAPHPMSHSTQPVLPADLAESVRLLKLADPSIDISPGRPRRARRSCSGPAAIEGPVQPVLRSDRNISHINSRQSVRSVSVPDDLQVSARLLRQAQEEVSGSKFAEERADPSEPELTPLNMPTREPKDLIRFMEQISDHDLPFTKIALTGFAGTGKSYCLRTMLAKIQKTASNIQILKLDASEPNSVTLDYPSFPSSQTSGPLSEIICVLESLIFTGSGRWLVLIDAMNHTKSTTSLRAWSRRIATLQCCLIVATRRLDLAQLFAEDSDSVYLFSTMSEWHAAYHLRQATPIDIGAEHLVRTLTYFPVAIMNAAGLMKSLNMTAVQFNAHLRVLLHTLLDSDPAVRAAYTCASRFFASGIWPSNNELSATGQDTSSMYVILSNCINPSWLATLDQIHHHHPGAVGFLAALATLAKPTMDEAALMELEEDMELSGMVACLRNYCVLTMSTRQDGRRVYNCHTALYMAVKVWMINKPDRIDEVVEVAERLQAKLGNEQ